VSQDTRVALRGRSYQLTLAASFIGFGGYALMLPVVPLWASRGGAGAFGAGATTGLLMLATVGTQFVVPGLLRRIGHRAVLGLGMVLLGGPTPLYALTTELPPLLGISLLRGIGFGLVTVAGSALVAELIPAAEHGRAAARYGLAVGLPQLVLLPAGVAVAESVGFAALFVLAGALPVAGAIIVLRIRVPRNAVGPDPGIAQDWRSVRSSAGPWLAMLSCSVAQGGLITFLPLALPGSGLLVPAALLGTAAGALLGRIVAAELAARFRLSGRLVAAGVLTAALGMAAEVLAALGTGGVLLAVMAILGAALVGIGFGTVQNDSLVVMFAAAGVSGYGAASAAWNIAYDAGTGLGAVGLGAAAQTLGYPAAFGFSAALLAVVLPAARRARHLMPGP
jgi:predicted MFS family arabinose efflux permease